MTQETQYREEGKKKTKTKGPLLWLNEEKCSHVLPIPLAHTTPINNDDLSLMNVIHSKNYTMGSCPYNNNKNQALVPKFQGQLSTHTQKIKSNLPRKF